MSDKNGFRVAIVTASDKGSRGEREDVSAGVIRTLVEGVGYTVVHYSILPDEPQTIASLLKDLCDMEIADLVLTTGGTGLAERDCTPEATLQIAQRLVPGISEAMRNYSMTITKRAMLSRGVSVVRNKSLVINLPGSPKAVEESLAYILSELPHALQILQGKTDECARQ